MKSIVTCACSSPVCFPSLSVNSRLAIHPTWLARAGSLSARNQNVKTWYARAYTYSGRSSEVFACPDTSKPLERAAVGVTWSLPPPPPPPRRDDERLLSRTVCRYLKQIPNTIRYSSSLKLEYRAGSRLRQARNSRMCLATPCRVMIWDILCNIVTKDLLIDMGSS